MSMQQEQEDDFETADIHRKWAEKERELGQMRQGTEGACRRGNQGFENAVAGPSNDSSL